MEGSEKKRCAAGAGDSGFAAGMPADDTPACSYDAAGEPSSAADGDKGLARRFDIEGVLFDLDGTLLDTHDLLLASFRHAVHEVLGEAGDAIPDETLMAKVGQPLNTQMWDFSGPDEQLHDELCRVYREYNHRIHDQMVRPFPGADASLSALTAAGLGLGVVTSKRHALAIHGLELFGLDARFRFLIGADDWETAKPDPGPILHGCDLLGIDPARCVYVGDSPYDMQAGNAAGCITVAATWGMFDRALLEAQRPDAWCASLAGLPDVILGA